MNTAKLQKLVDELTTMDREHRKLGEELKVKKAELVQEAVSREEEHTATEKGGKSWVVTGNDGCIARVTFPARKLKSVISGTAKDLPKIQEAAGRHFPTLFPQAPAYSLVEGFRERATELLGTKSKKLIRLVETESPVSVSFETKDEES